MKPVLLHPAAEAEMRAAAGFYQQCQPGLGDRFLDEVLQAAGRMQRNPEAWPVVSGDIRRCLLHLFPFGLLFRTEADRLYVLAVMHLKRKPNYWKERIE